MRLISLTVLSLALLAAVAQANPISEMFGAIDVEQPSYRVIEHRDGLEVRQYGQQLRATYTWKSDDPEALNLVQKEGDAFRVVASYIFGGNTKRESISMTAPVVTEKIAMTAPVVTEHSEGAYKKLSFILPSRYHSLEDLPVPNNPNVKLEEVPPYQTAVLKFTWRATKPMVLQKERELRAKAAQAGIELSTSASDVSLLQYNPPWCIPFLRTNEIAIKVKEHTQTNATGKQPERDNNSNQEQQQSSDPQGAATEIIEAPEGAEEGMSGSTTAKVTQTVSVVRI